MQKLPLSKLINSIVILYINIHSHTKSQSNGQLVIHNHYKDFETIDTMQIHSIGLHPWYIAEPNWQQQFELLKKYSHSTYAVAIGECGLDKVCNTDFRLQQKVFLRQVGWANEINKPLIIHCVKAFDEVLKQLKLGNNKVPVIFHGFNKNGTLAKQLIEHEYYLSFGKALQNKSMQAIFATVPKEQIFLETDDADIGIEKIYDYAAASINIDVNTLSLQIAKNAELIFGKSIFQL